MAIKLFKMRHVPDDEAAEIRQLLESHEIKFYETEAGGWGISAPAIWIHDESRLAEAQALIDAYQQERAQRARADYAQLKSEGRHPTLWGNIRRHPLQAVLLLLMAIFVLYVTLAPFIDL